MILTCFSLPLLRPFSYNGTVAWLSPSRYLCCFGIGLDDEERRGLERWRDFVPGRGAEDAREIVQINEVLSNFSVGA
jgi:hypothetical protein